MPFINIVEENEPFEWSPETEDGKKTDSVFTLVVLSEDLLTALRKKHTHITWKNGQRIDDFAAFDFAADVVDKAVQGWKGVVRAKTGEAVACDRANKLRLPERLKVEILRLCAGKEAGRLYEDVGLDPKKS